MSKIRVILSTNGPLYLIKSAEFLARIVDIRVIQGWIPGRFSKYLIGIASKIIGRDLSKSFKKRTPEILKNRNYSVALPEFYFWFRRSVVHKDDAITAAKLYGFLSKRFINNADIFHVRSGSGFSAIKKAKRQGMKVIVDHSIAHPSFIDRQLRDEYSNNGVKFDMGTDSKFWNGVISDCAQADFLLVNSDFVKNTFIEQGYDRNKIRVAIQGVRQDFFSLKSDYHNMNVVRILFTGSWGFRKGAEYILKALNKLDESNLQYQMTVVGSYSGSEELLQKYNPKNIDFVGFIVQDELKKYLSESDIYLFPSLCEGCASSGMEALAAGLPVITTLESGLPINNGENGILVPSKNENAIVDAITLLAKNEDKRTVLGTNAAKTIAENYTWEKYALQVCEYYNELIR